MAINSLRNKPLGPGGGTRRLHQDAEIYDLKSADAWGQSLANRWWSTAAASWRGRNRIDEGVKVVLLPGMVPPLSGQPYSCQWQLCGGSSRRV